MPKTNDEMKMYEDMLDELAAEYPELEESALTLKGDMMEMDVPEEDPEMADMEMEGEEYPEDDGEEYPEEEEEYPEDEDEEEDEMAGFEKY